MDMKWTKTKRQQCNDFLFDLKVNTEGIKVQYHMNV